MTLNLLPLALVNFWTSEIVGRVESLYTLLLSTSQDMGNA